MPPRTHKHFPSAVSKVITYLYWHVQIVNLKFHPYSFYSKSFQKFALILWLFYRYMNDMQICVPQSVRCAINSLPV